MHRTFLLSRLLVGIGASLPPALSAQSLLDRAPNLSGDWVVQPGTVQFNFLHRFTRGKAPARKVSNFPTFLLATGLPVHSTVGFFYSTNSTLVPGYPNEWEFFGRIQPIAQDRGAPLDLGGELGYNLASDGLDGEVSLARRMGPVKLIAAGRALSDPYSNSGKAQLAFGGGLNLRVTRHLALAGDLSTMKDRNKARDEKVAWSAGLHVAIPNTPHTLSFHATNTTTATLQGISRGDKKTRYGFEFTIPITLARYFGRKPRPAVAPAPEVAAPGVPAGPEVTNVRKTLIQNLAFVDGKISIPAGTTIEWRNQDQLPHSVTADDASFDSGLIDAGGAWRYTFTRPGTYSFHCTPHPFMKGTVVVQ